MENQIYEVKFTDSAEKDLKKLSKTNKAIAKLIKIKREKHIKMGK